RTLLLGCLIGRRRGGALTDDFLLGSWRCRRRCIFFRCRRRVGAGGRRRLFLPGGLFRLGFFGWRRWRSSSGRCRVGIGLFLGAFIERLRDTLFEAGHAVRKYRLALALQLLLGVDPVEPIHRVKTVDVARTADERAAQRNKNGSGDQTLQATHDRFLVQPVFLFVKSCRQLLATGGSSAWSASAR